jgi:tetratricopeptide (TPR) repeat protein
MNNFESQRPKSDQEIAEEHEKNGDLEKAAEAYEVAGIYDKASEIWTRLGKPEKAVEVYIVAAESIESEPFENPESIKANFGRSDLLRVAAELRERAGDYKNAAKNYREAANYAKVAAVGMEPNRYFDSIRYEVPFEYDRLLNKAKKAEEKLKQEEASNEEGSGGNNNHTETD